MTASLNPPDVHMPDEPGPAGAEQEVFASPLSESEEVLVSAVVNSRKRFLSPSVLRGDQAVDRLKQQELSASPFLKKPKPLITTEDKMALSSAEFREYMAENVARRFDKIETAVESIEGTVKSHTSKIDNHERLIRDSQREIAALKRDVDGLADRRSTTPGASPGTSSLRLSAPQRVRQAVNDSDYFRARRTLRLWPIVGSTGEELWRATGNFLHVLLGLPNIDEAKIEQISRPPVPSSFGASNEIQITFKSVETRDSVIGASGRLAGKVDEQGRPTAGIRIEVPQGLKDAFSVLYKFGQVLRTRHGAGTRRHVKFDDVDRTLFLNIKLPGDDRWSRVDVDLARRSISTRNRIESQELETRLDLGGTDAEPRPRPASTSTAPVQGTRRPEPWTGRRTESSSS